MQYRKFKRRDEQRLAEIIRDTWGYNRLSSNPDVALLMGKIYLYNCLAAQNYHLVATLQGKPVGIIMGNIKKNKQRKSLFYQLKLLWYYKKMSRYEEGKFILELFNGFDQLDQEMLKELHKNYHAELVFFVTDAQVRGQHIGTKLYQSFLRECDKNSCKNLYVYTDDSCNYGFYEHQGFRRVNRRLHCVFDHSFEFYVYEKEFCK